MGAQSPARPRARRALWMGAAILGCALLGWCDLRGERPQQAEIVEVVRGSGALAAGAGQAALNIVAEVAKAGYPPLRPTASGQDTPLMARAMVLRLGEATIGLVSLDLLEVSEELSEAIGAKARALGVSATLVTATHAHSSFGGCDRNLAAQVAALGRFEADQQRAVIDRAAEALARAVGQIGPVRARWAVRPLPGLNRNRAQPGGPVDRDLRVLAFESLPRGERIATLFSFDAHPTLVARRSARLDADFPGRAAALIEAASGGTALFFQGAAGDASATPPQSDGLSGSASMAAHLAAEVERALASAEALPIGEAALARASIALPRAQAPAGVPKLFQRPAAKILQAVLMERAQLTLIRLGELLLLAIPGEPTFFVGADLRRAIAGHHRGPLLFVGLAHGYVGYVESAERRRQGIGESRRALWAPDLDARLAAGFQLLFDAIAAGTPAT